MGGGGMEILLCLTGILSDEDFCEAPMGGGGGMKILFCLSGISSSLSELTNLFGLLRDLLLGSSASVSYVESSMNFCTAALA